MLFSSDTTLPQEESMLKNSYRRLKTNPSPRLLRAHGTLLSPFPETTKCRRGSHSPRILTTPPTLSRQIPVYIARVQRAAVFGNVARTTPLESRVAMKLGWPALAVVGAGNGRAVVAIYG